MRGPIALCLLATLMLPLATRGAAATRGSCFLLDEIGVGEIRRTPSTSCAARVSPESTFKIAHALAALDAGVIADAGTVIRDDGHDVDFPAWRGDQTLATAMRFSVVWYFQDIARRLGADRERRYLEKLGYGNQDSSSGLTTFWLGGSLAISPDEQLAFLRRLFTDGQLPVSQFAVDVVRGVLIQPKNVVVNAQGPHPFGAPWPAGVVVRAKTGAGPDGEGGAVRWLVGHVQRRSRAWIFVSNVVGGADLSALAAVDQAARALVDAKVLR